MGWIAAAVMALITLGVLSVLWRRHRREVQYLRSAHQVTLHRLDEEHDRRLARLSREFERDLSSAHHPLARDLLPALDSLDEALTHMRQSLKEESHGGASELYKGVEIARQAIDAALARHQILTILPDDGDPFDPQFHEAMSRYESAEAEPNTIARLLRRGYRDGERVLRAALVEVYVAPVEHGGDQAPSHPEEEQADEAQTRSEPDTPSEEPPGETLH